MDLSNAVQRIGDRVGCYSFIDGLSQGAIDVHAEMKRKNITIDEARNKIVTSNLPIVGSSLDIMNWLPGAAKEYHISPRFEDYFLVPVIIMPSDLPNRNAVGFPLRELNRFLPEYGVQTYRSFIGKPVQYEHNNKDITKAYGIILDTYLHKMNNYGSGKVWKFMELLAIDRTKNSHITQKVLNREINSYSMGAMVAGYTCSYCAQELGKCSHLDKSKNFDFYELNGRLVFRQVYNAVGFETSIVGTPAFVSAISDSITDVR